MSHWGTDHQILSLSYLLNRPVFQFNTFFSVMDGRRSSVLEHVHTTNDLVECFRNHEFGTRTHILYCVSSIAYLLTLGGISDLEHPPLTICNINNRHWVAMLLKSPSVLAHVPVPTTRLYVDV